MRPKQQKMTEKAWVSRFWAEYSRLPETYKMGFFNMVQNLVIEAGNQRQPIQPEKNANPILQINN